MARSAACAPGADGASSLPPKPPPVTVCTIRARLRSQPRAEATRLLHVERALHRALHHHAARAVRRARSCRWSRCRRAPGRACGRCPRPPPRRCGSGRRSPRRGAPSSAPSPRPRRAPPPCRAWPASGSYSTCDRREPLGQRPPAVSAATSATASPTWRTKSCGQHGPVGLDHGDQVAAGDLLGRDHTRARRATRARAGRVQLADARVRVRRAQDAAAEGARLDQVLDVERRALDLVGRVGAPQALADHGTRGSWAHGAGA